MRPESRLAEMMVGQATEAAEVVAMALVPGQKRSLAWRQYQELK